MFGLGDLIDDVVDVARDVKDEAAGLAKCAARTVTWAAKPMVSATKEVVVTGARSDPALDFLLDQLKKLKRELEKESARR